MVYKPQYYNNNALYLNANFPFITFCQSWLFMNCISTAVCLTSDYCRIKITHSAKSRLKFGGAPHSPLLQPWRSDVTFHYVSLFSVLWNLWAERHYCWSTFISSALDYCLEKLKTRVQDSGICVYLLCQIVKCQASGCFFVAALS